MYECECERSEEKQNQINFAATVVNNNKKTHFKVQKHVSRDERVISRSQSIIIHAFIPFMRAAQIHLQSTYTIHFEFIRIGLSVPVKHAC